MNFLGKVFNGNNDWSYDHGQGIKINQNTGEKIDILTGSRVYKKNGIHVLHLRGDPYARGFAHGKLMKKEILESNMAEYYGGSFLRHLVKNSNTIIPGKTLEWLIEKWYYDPLEGRCMEEIKFEMHGVADACGIDKKTAMRAILAPDVMEHLASGFLKGGKEALGNYYLGGCSSAYARQSAVRDKSRAFFSRNMDFPGVFVWRNPALIFSHPTEEIEVNVKKDGRFVKEKKLKQSYAYLTSLGFPGIGLTGLNSSGIALGTFVCLSKDISKFRRPTLDFNHYLFTRAESIDGIIDLLESEDINCASPHTVMYADKDEAISIEVTGNRHAVRMMSPKFDINVQTNHFLNPMMKQREIEFPLEREYTIGRFRLIRNAMEENYGRIDLQKMVDIISSNLDPATGETRMVGDFPAQGITLTSAVFELSDNPSQNRIWMASGIPPAVCYNDFLGFNFQDELAGRRYNLPKVKRSNTSVLADHDFRPLTDEMRRSQKLMMLSNEELVGGDLKAAIENIEEAIKHYPDPGYKYIRALLYLRNFQPERSLEIIRDIKDKHSFAPVKQDALDLWEGRCLDVLGRSQEAVHCYKELLQKNHLTRHLKKAIKANLKKPYNLNTMPKIFDYYTLGPLEFY